MVVAAQLLESGVIVVPVVETGHVQALRETFLAVVTTLPELKQGATVPAFGGFGALGLPSSFHHPFIRSLRGIQYGRGSEIFADLASLLAPDGAPLLLEQLVDRAQLRQPGTSATPESFHRDFPASSARDGDYFFGGWLNLDLQDQGFSCIFGSHDPRPFQRGHGTGFTPFKKEDKAELKTRSTVVAIPPGHMIIFFSNIVHEVLPRKREYPSARLYSSWRLTAQQQPLFEDIAERLARQDAVPLPSGQKPPMYAKLHWVNHTPRLSAWATATLKDEFLTVRTVGSGARKGQEYAVPPEYLENSGKHYPDYSAEELAAHVPHVPSRKRARH